MADDRDYFTPESNKQWVQVADRIAEPAQAKTWHCVGRIFLAEAYRTNFTDIIDWFWENSPEIYEEFYPGENEPAFHLAEREINRAANVLTDYAHGFHRITFEIVHQLYHYPPGVIGQADFISSQVTDTLALMQGDSRAGAWRCRIFSLADEYMREPFPPGLLDKWKRVGEPLTQYVERSFATEELDPNLETLKNAMLDVALTLFKRHSHIWRIQLVIEHELFRA